MLLFSAAVPNARRDVERALLLMVLSATFFGVMAYAAKVASARLSGPEVALIRFVVGISPVLLVPRYRRAATTFQRIDLLLYRGFFGGLAVLFYFIAIAHTSVGVATLLNYTAPIFSGVFSMIFIGERISPKVLLPMPVALTGILLVVRAHARPGDFLGFGRWELIGLLSAVCSGAAVTAIRAARRGESSWAIYGSFCLLGVLTTAPLGIANWRTPHGNEWLALGAMSLLAIFAQLLMTFTLRWVDAMTVGVISQLAVLVSMALGALLLGETITPMTAIGSVLSISGVCGVVYVTSLARPTASADAVAPEA